MYEVGNGSVATKLPFPKNLLVDTGLYRDELPEDIAERLETVINDILHTRNKKYPDRDFKMVMARYKEQRTYRNIAEEFGLSQGAVIQSIGWVLRKLRYGYVRHMIFRK